MSAYVLCVSVPFGLLSVSFPVEKRKFTQQQQKKDFFEGERNEDGRQLKMNPDLESFNSY